MEVKQQQLLWQARRGMLELDLILKDFIINSYPKCNKDLQVKFQALLKCTDQELYNWLIKNQLVSNVEHKEIINAIREQHQT